MAPEKHPLLEGIRVVEVASMIMAPSAATVLSDYGAEVVKIEPPGVGDQNRYLHQLTGYPVSDVPYAFFQVNRNKRSVALDLKNDAARGALTKLIERADVFITNYREPALKKLKLTWDDVRAVNPRTIYAWATGHGEKGPEAGRPAYDTIVFWARSALEASLFPVDGWPGSIPAGTGDHPSGMALFGAIMTALFARERSGHGYKVGSSLLANGAWTNSCIIEAKLVNAQFRPKPRREEAYNFSGVYYLTQDKRTFKFAIVDPVKDWPKICRSIEKPEMITDERFATVEARAENVQLIIRILDDAFAKHDLAYWQTTLQDHDLPFGMISTYDDVIADEQMHANDIFIEIDDPEFGKLRSVNSPFHIDGEPKVPPKAAPRLGEHTREVLAELGYSEQEIARIVRIGLV